MPKKITCKQFLAMSWIPLLDEVEALRADEHRRTCSSCRGAEIDQRLKVVFDPKLQALEDKERSHLAKMAVHQEHSDVHVWPYSSYTVDEYLRGLLAEDEKRIIDSHLTSCGECKEAFEFLRQNPHPDEEPLWKMRPGYEPDAST